MKYTPIVIEKKEKNYKTKAGRTKKYTYYEAKCTVQLAKSSYRQTGSGKTRQAAKEALLKKLDVEEKKNLSSVPVKSETLIDALYHFIDYKLSEGWAQSTYVRNKTTIDHQVFSYLISLKHPLEITHNDVLEYIEELRGMHYSISTIDKAYSLLQLYFNYVYQDNMAQNPCYGIHLGYDPVLSPDKVLNSDEAKAFFEACDEIGGNADLLQFIFLTYERPGEASTLRFSDWNKSDKTLKINRTKTVDKDGKVIVGSEGKTKTKSSRRTIKLNSASNDILIKRYNERWRSLGKRPGSAYIWVQKNDSYKPIDYNTLRRLLVKVLDKAGISKHITLHGLRHSGITYYGKDRDQFLAISKSAGHSRPSITEDKYSHLLDEHIEAAAASADKMNLFLKGESNSPLPTADIK